MKIGDIQVDRHKELIAAAEGWEADDIDATIDTHRDTGGTCRECGQPWPCAPLRALGEARLA